MGPIIGLFSNVIRAERWKMLLNSVGEKPSRVNVINSVFVMYAGNLLFPRLGEVTRCSLLYKTDNVPIDKSIGTMVLERIVDMVTLLLIGVLLMFSNTNCYSDCSTIQYFQVFRPSSIHIAAAIC